MRRRDVYPFLEVRRWVVAHFQGLTRQEINEVTSWHCQRCQACGQVPCTHWQVGGPFQPGAEMCRPEFNSDPNHVFAVGVIRQRGYQNV